MNESVRGYVEAIRVRSEDAGKLAEVASAIAEFARAIESSKDLMEVLGDPSFSSRAKAEIVGDLLARSNALAIKLGQTIVMSEAPKYILDTFMETHRLLEIDDLASYVGADSTKSRANGFAKALFGLATPLDLETCEDQLFRFARSIEANRPLRRALSGMGSHPSQRREIVDDLLKEKTSKLSWEVARYAVSITVVRDIVEIIDGLVSIAAQERNLFVCQLRSARELGPEEIERIRLSLAANVGRELEARAIVDPSLLAGVVAVVGDEIFDGSARRRIDQLRVRLSSSS